jgi:hypothetical protein
MSTTDDLWDMNMELQYRVKELEDRIDQLEQLTKGTVRWQDLP